MAANRARTMPNRTRMGLAIVLALSAGIAGVLAYLSPEMAPIQRGSVNDFWKVACRIDLDEPTRGPTGMAYVPNDNWFAYEAPHLHGSDVYRVPTEDALAVFDRVVSALTEEVDGGAALPYIEQGFSKWRKSDATRDGDARSLLNSIEAARGNDWKVRDLDLYAYNLQVTEAFYERWHRAK